MKTNPVNFLFASTLLLFSLFAPALMRVVPAVITVTTVDDVIAVDGQCSLREAVIAANTNVATSGCPAGGGVDMIVFSSSLPSPAIFTLTQIGANEDRAATGDLDFHTISTIQGMGAGQTILDGNGADRVFDVRPGATVTISGLTVRNGNPGSGADGGGILVTGRLPTSRLNLVDAHVINNSATSGGGVQIVGNGAKATIQNARISLNVATTAGGGISNNGVLILLDSILDQNQARTGGGVDHSGFSMNMTNVTVSSNSVSDNGGGIYNRMDALILNVTISDNLASGVGTGGGIYNDQASLSIKNSIIANPLADENCSNSAGVIHSQGYNLDSGVTCGFASAGDMVNTDPLLGPLQDNGGKTYTQALLAGSPAIDHADNNGCPKTDQRGVTRPQGLRCDIGAFERVVVNAPETTIGGKPAAFDNDNTPTFTFSGIAGAGTGISSFMCRVDGGGYASCASPYTLVALADGLHTFNVYAIDTLGNADATPASHTWTVDTTAPETAIVIRPPTLDNNSTPTFTFMGNDGPGRGVAYFMCRVDGGVYGACPNPYISSPLVDGSHTIEVYAVDGLGIADTTSASHTWTVDTTAPETTIVNMPPTLDNNSAPTFTFTGNDGTGGGVASFMCRMDGGVYGACPNPYISSPLVDGSHVFDVYAVDILGNADATPASHTWTVETIAPTIISSTRVNPGSNNLASVDFLITFSEPVTGVDVVGPAFDDFIHITSSYISGVFVSNVSGSGAAYTVTVNTGSGNGTIRLDVGTTGHIVDAFNNPLAGGFTGGETYSIIKTATFADVPLTYWASNFIERLYIAGITGGCGTSPLIYCPDASVSRAQMAIFLLRAKHGPAYIPPAATGSVFGDVPINHWAAPWIEQVYVEGITSGCGSGNYCPESIVSRDQMAVFLLRTKHGSTYFPPAATGIFTDVPVDYWAAAWIEQLVAEGITTGCGGGNFCPGNDVTRAQMAVFLVKTFNLP